MIKNYLKNTKKLKSAFGIGANGTIGKRMWYMDAGLTTALSLKATHIIESMKKIRDAVKEVIKKMK